jgi:hypothetical protein
MSYKIISKTLATVSTLTLFVSIFGANPALADGPPSCIIVAPNGVVTENSSVGEVCLDEKGHAKKLKKANCIEKRAEAGFFSRIVDDFEGSCFKGAEKEYKEQYGNVGACSNDGGTGGCHSAKSSSSNANNRNRGNNNNNDGSNGNNNNGNNVVVVDNNGGGGNNNGGSVVVTGGHSGSANGNVGRGNNNSNNPQANFDALAKHCGDNGDLTNPDYSKTRASDLDQIVASLKNYDKNCSGDDCVDLDGLKRDMDASLNSCQDACDGFAFDEDGACYWKNLVDASSSSKDPIFDSESDVCKDLVQGDANKKVAKFISGLGAAAPIPTGPVDPQAAKPDPSTQVSCTQQAPGSKGAKGKLCGDMMKDQKCMQAMKADPTEGNGKFNCDAFHEAADKYFAALAAKKKLLADQKMLNGPSDARKCKIDNAADIKTVFDNDTQDKVSIKCLQDMEASCENALDSAQSKFKEYVQTQRDTAVRSGQCTNCGGGSQQGQGATCNYGGCVSHGAQVLGGVASVIGALTPLGLGAMNMASYYKCQNVNQSIVSQQIAVETATGVNGPLSMGSCGGVGGFGMGGYGGIGGMSGIGGYSPYGSTGGYGGIGGYGSPFGSTGGYGGIGGYGSPFGSTGGYGGIGGYGSPYGSTGYNPYGGSMGGLGMNPYGNQYGGGIGAAGLGGLYQNNQIQSQQNLGSVISQIGQQNSLIGGSSYGMGGAYSGYSPYGYSGSYNPYSSMGGLSLNLGVNSYNPYSMGGYGGGSPYTSMYGGGAGAYGSSMYGSSMYGSPYGSTSSACGYYQAAVPCGSSGASGYIP